MRFAGALLGVSLTIFGSAIAVTRQDQNPPAEQAFKNIQSFKGAKAGDVIPAMHFMCASLKVSCDYCHTEDRASDEKRAKGTSREMIAMQRDINQRYFNGRNQVTCATCHAGHTHPVALPPALGIDVRVRRSADVSVDQVMAAYAKASGETPGASTEGLRLSGTMTLQGKTSPMEAMYLGNRYVFNNQIPNANGVSRSGFNGTVAWFGLTSGVQAVPYDLVQQYVNSNFLLSGPGSLPKLDQTAGGTTKLEGRDVQTVAGTMQDGSRLTLYFDKQSGQLVRSQYSYPTVLGNIPQINDYSDYRRVGGAVRPMTIVMHAAENDITVHFRSARVDPKIVATDFDPPK